MSISVDGQYVFQFSLGPLNDFIEESDLLGFVLYEEAGNALPTFEMSMMISDESVLRYLHEGNDLKVSFGKDRRDLISVPLSVTRFHTMRSGDGQRTVNCVGIYSATPYISGSEVFVSTQKSALEVLKEFVTKFGFKFRSNITKSLDSQVWIQPNCSPKKFVNDLWMHMDLGTSFPVCGVTASGEFVLNDFKKDLTSRKTPFGKPYHWRFTSGPTSEAQDIQYNGDVHMKMDASYLNHWVGHGREKVVYDMDSGETTSSLFYGESNLSLTPDIPRSAVSRRFGGPAVRTSNMHANYHDSYNHNLSQLVALSKTQVILSFQNRFYPLRVLDQVIFKDEALLSKSSSSEFTAGVYYISKLTRALSGRAFTTTVVLSRESFNQIQNRA
jgi:hypothetical protein